MPTPAEWGIQETEMNRDNRNNRRPQQNRRNQDSRNRLPEPEIADIIFDVDDYGAKVCEGGDGRLTHPVIRFNPNPEVSYRCLRWDMGKRLFAAPISTDGLPQEVWMTDAALRNALHADLKFREHKRGDGSKFCLAYMPNGQFAYVEHGFQPAVNEVRRYRGVISPDGFSFVAKGFVTEQTVGGSAKLGDTVSKDQQVQMGLVQYRGQLRNVFEVLGVKNPKAPTAVINACHNKLRSQLESDKARVGRVPEARRMVEEHIRELKTVYETALKLNEELRREERQAKRQGKAETGKVQAEATEGVVMIAITKAPMAEPTVTAKAEDIEVENVELPLAETPTVSETVKTEVALTAAEPAPEPTVEVRASAIQEPVYKPVPENADPQVKKMIERENSGAKRRYEALVQAAKQPKAAAKKTEKKAEPVKGLAALAALTGKLPSGG